MLSETTGLFVAEDGLTRASGGTTKVHQHRVEVLSAMSGVRSISHRMICTMIGGHPRKASTHSCVSAKENVGGETVSRE